MPTVWPVQLGGGVSNLSKVTDHGQGLIVSSHQVTLYFHLAGSSKTSDEDVVVAFHPQFGGEGHDM